MKEESQQDDYSLKAWLEDQISDFIGLVCPGATVEQELNVEQTLSHLL